MASIAKAPTGDRSADRDLRAGRTVPATTALSVGNVETRAQEGTGTIPEAAAVRSEAAVTARRETGRTAPTVNVVTTDPAPRAGIGPRTTIAAPTIAAPTIVAPTIVAPVSAGTTGPGTIGAQARPAPVTDPSVGTAVLRVAAAAKAVSARAGVAKVLLLRVATLVRTSRIFPKTSKRPNWIRPSAGIC